MIIDSTGGKAHYAVLNAHDELVNYSISVVKVCGSIEARVTDRHIVLARENLYRTDWPGAWPMGSAGRVQHHR